MTDNNDLELLVHKEAPIMHVTLNRPHALNALSFQMICDLYDGLAVWGEDDDVKAVFIEGAGDKAFCAGGDVKATYNAGIARREGRGDENFAALFFGKEYNMNRALFHFNKPVIAFMDGITMGGGFGVAGPCDFRIATERTVFAMPEVVIGFFPDVGSAYFLNRAPGEAGAYLAMTGNKIGPSDTLFCGFATHFVPSGRLDECKAALLAALETDGQASVEDILTRFAETPEGEGDIQENMDVINECFRSDDAQAIVTALKQSDSKWATAQAALIESRAPLSVKISLAHLRKAADMSFDEVTAQDFVLSQHFMAGFDFYEGVRALLVDKDNKPQWQPGTLEQVTDTMVEGYFCPVGVTLDEIAA